MSYYDYKCYTCGFISEEQLAEYQCPVCGNKMRTKEHKNSFTGARDKKVWVYFLEAVPLLSIAIALFPIGTIFSIVVFLLTRKLLNNKYRDKAIRIHSTEIMKNSWKVYSCAHCGNTFEGQRPNCPHCGGVLNYTD